MRKIKYDRTEFHAGDESVENDLLSFVYDIPYFGACGIFPPIHIVNTIFLEGGGDGGMSPGAIWTPFEITEKEYEELVEAVKNTPLTNLEGKARYCEIQFEFDPEFDHIIDQFDWLQEVCKKHRENFHKKLDKFEHT
ncbi:hypothetical protein [Desulfosarcina ovata]|nr:hypothetical protein [Desulfosarcina ovata]